jgi:integrase
MKLALYTGMRRGELFKLRWDDVDFEKGFIFIRSPKGKKSMHIPMNDQARDILKNHPRVAEHVFITDKGKPFTEIRKRVDSIRTAAGCKGLSSSTRIAACVCVFAGEFGASGHIHAAETLTHKSTA